MVQHFSYRRVLLVLCLLALVANILVFWPNVRDYANVVAQKYEEVNGKNVDNGYIRVSESSIHTGLKNTSSSSSSPSKTEEQRPEVKKGDIVQVVKIEETKKDDEEKEEKDEDENLPICPEVPPGLVGPLAGLVKEVGKADVEAMHQHGSADFTSMDLGGKSRPVSCRSRQKLAIVIPYRNRYAHLHILLNNLIPILRRQQKEFQIFVIEQNMPTLFNRGMLFNVGFLEALKFEHFDCFVFHDVDMLPLNDNALYTCKDNPLHLAAWTDKWAGGLPYKKYFGGVVMFSKEQFEKINGDSNLYFGWGGEDDDLWGRVKTKGYTPIRYPQQIGRYKMIKHKRDSGNEADKSRFALLNHANQRMEVEGLSSTVYDVTSIEVLPLYTWIKVSVNRDLILKNGTPKKGPRVVRAPPVVKF